MVRLRVKEVAREKGMNMARLSRRADIDYKTVQYLFHDPYRDVTLSTLTKIAKALDVPVTSLIVDEFHEDGQNPDQFSTEKRRSD